MTRWLDRLRLALGDRPLQRWFFRDDDAGWEDRRLAALTGAFRDTGVKVDLAAIPATISPALGRRLADLVDDGAVSVHQHGWAHANHERSGRRCEFGPSRGLAAQARDIARGQRALAERLGRPPAPIFTPPWNRCTPVTAELLADMGFAALSADSTAPLRDVAGLTEIPVTVDWTRCFSRGGRTELARALLRAGATCGDRPIGLMLHHAVMHEDELVALRELLALLRETVTLTSIAALVDESSLTSISPSGHAAPAR
ncbi:MAG: polysaccharide deacetylase family protein [Solirubrobacteraceae bacterium]